MNFNKAFDNENLPDSDSESMRDVTLDFNSAFKNNELSTALDINSNPIVNKHLSNFSNPHDDISVLASIEGYLGSFNKGWLGQVIGSTVEGLGRTLDVGGRFTARGLDLILPESADKYIYETDETPELIKTLNMLDPAEGLREAGQGIQSFAESLVPEHASGFTHDVTSGLGQVIGQIASAAAAPVTALPTLFAQGVNIQGEKQELTSTEGQNVTSDLALLSGGVITATTERIALDKILDRVPPNIKNKYLRQIADLTIAGGIEATQEVIEGFTQNLIEYYTTNPDAELIEGLEDEAAVAGTVGVVIRALVNTALPGKAGAVVLKEEQNARTNELGQVTIDQINEQSENSKLRERDNEAFKQFVEDADGDNNTTLFIDGVQTRLYLADRQGQVESDPALQLLAEKVTEAAALGGDLAIPVSEFAGTLAGTEHFSNLRDFMTLSEETQAPFRQEQSQAETQSYIDSLVQEAQETSSQYVESQDIFESVRDQLIDTGVVNAQNASVMAQIVPAWATVQAERNGVSVREVYENSGLTIEGPQTGELSRLSREGELLSQEVLDNEELVTHSGGAITEIGSGIFDGIFGSYGDSSSGGVNPENKQTSFAIKSENIASSGDGSFDYDRAIEWIKKEFPDKSDEDIDILYEWIAEDKSDPWGENVLVDDGFPDPGEASWEAQRLRGQLALSQGFDAVEMDDETGTSVLIPKGSKARIVKRDYDLPLSQSSVDDLPLSQSSVDDFANRITEQYNLEDFFLIETRGDIKLENFIVPKTDQSQGTGTAVMNELTEYADVHGKRIVLSPGLRDDRKGTTSRSRLVKFYKRFDFVENKGRNKDFTTSAGMYRDPKSAEQLEQRQGVTRGFYDPANSVIRLTEAADLSTFLHEFAHFMYEMELTAHRVSPDSINTISGIHNWFKRNAQEVAREASEYKPKATIIPRHVEQYLDEGTTGDAERDAGIRRAVHEQFARGFEKYVMEGKSPSNELRNAFRTFARWLTQVYRAVRGDMKVNLDDEMREVFDRLLATEEQINAAESRAQYQPMFTDAAMAGMTEEEFQKYQERTVKVKDVQTETLRDKLIKEFTRQTKSWWKEEKADLVDEQLQILRNEPVYRARESLKDGDIKLDHATVKEMIGEERTDKRGRKSVRVPESLRGMTVTGAKGVHPDEAAAFFGYGSGSELLSSLTDAAPIKVKAEANAEEQMLNKYGDMLHDGTIEAQADEAVQNEERGKLLLDELKALRKRSASAPALDRATIKQMAEENIAKLSFRQIHPGKYRKAEIRAAQEAATALANGDMDQAARAKARQVLNYYLGMAATQARADTIKIVDRMARYNKKSVREEIQKAENGYWEQIVKILNRFEFRKAVSLKVVDQQNQDINTWAKERIETDGDALVLSPAVMNESFVTHWKNVPYGDLQGVNDSVKNIEHVARYSNKMTRMGEEIEFKKLVQRWTDHMRGASKTRFKSQRTDVVEGRKWGRWAMAQMTKIPFMASWLDGGERAGMSHDILVQPFTDAYDAEINLWKDVGEVVMRAIEGRSKEDIKRHSRKVFIPELVDAQNDGNLYGHQIIAVALNTGNESNLRKLLLGEGWANPNDETTISMGNPKLQAVLRNMTKSDWDLVQLIWDQMELLYPQLSEVHRRTTGLTPPKIKATPVSTPFGEFRGGYYPVKYDPNRSQRAQENEDRLNAETESMFSNSSSIHASVTAGATNERTKYYAPIRLSLDVVPAHFQEAIHYITHHDPVREVNKLVRNPEVAATIKEKLGPEEYAQLKPWLNDIAKDGREAPTKMFWDDMISRLRFGITLGTMGFKASTGIIQISGLSNTIAELGLAPVYKSMRSILGSPQNMKDAWEFASSNSKVLNHRMQTMDREIKNAMKRLEGKRGVLAAVQELSMKHIALIQTYMVDLPSWQAAYIKEMEISGDEQKAYARADWTIENIQGSGATKDLSRIMRGQSETGRMLTMFMTFFSSLWNMERDLVKGTRSGRYSITNVGAKLAFLITVPVLFEMLMRGELGDEDDEPEEQLQKMLTKTALYPVASVPFVRDIASATTGEFGYNISPVASLIEQGTRAIPEVIERGFTDEEITKGQAKGATKFAGAAFGIPGTGQAWATGEHLYDVLERGEELTMQELLFGPERD